MSPFRIFGFVSSVVVLPLRLLPSHRVGRIVCGAILALTLTAGWHAMFIYQSSFECDGIHRLECLAAKLREQTEKEGIAAALVSFAKLYDDPAFSKDCHAIAHEIGKGAYERYKRGEKLEAVSELSYCSYGFYHGFLEAMVPDTGDPKSGRELCEKLQEEVTDGRSVIGPCLHGFGHGVTDGTNPELWGSFERMAQPSLEICKKIARSDDEKTLCAGGVFNALSLLLHDKKYGLPNDAAQPYAFCFEQSDPQYREACFRNFHTSAAYLNKQKFFPVAHNIETFDDRDAFHALDNFSTYQARLMVEPYTNPYIAAFCYSLEERLHSTCINGFAVGLLIFGEPGQEYERALSLCESETIRDKDKEPCFRRVLDISKQQYGTKIYKKICDLVSTHFRYLCEQSR